MNYLDMLILGVVVLTTGLGFVTGFVWQVAGLASLAVGATCALLFGGMVGEVIGGWLSEPRFGYLIAYIAIFSLASMAVRILATVMSHFLEKFKLKKFDRALGGLTGLIKGVIICIVVVACIGRFGSVDARATAQNSTLAGFVVQGTDWLLGQPKLQAYKDRAKDSFQNFRDSAKSIQGDIGGNASEAPPTGESTREEARPHPDSKSAPARNPPPQRPPNGERR